MVQSVYSPDAILVAVLVAKTVLDLVMVAVRDVVPLTYSDVLVYLVTFAGIVDMVAVNKDVFKPCHTAEPPATGAVLRREGEGLDDAYDSAVVTCAAGVSTVVVAQPWAKRAAKVL